MRLASGICAAAALRDSPKYSLYGFLARWRAALAESDANARVDAREGTCVISVTLGGCRSAAVYFLCADVSILPGKPMEESRAPIR
jgi:hypothetical protein